ncbi:sigma-70 family RNA polymerase sigma factor [bacterium]|nr:sigma-70 family RNA polymerase sigma factor [bacterium]
MRETDHMQEKQNPDADLIRLSASGDEGAFRQLFDRYEKRVMALAFRITEDPDLAADVTQEVFIRVYRSLPRFQVGKKFFTWLYRIAVNASIDALKKARRYREIPLDALSVDRFPSHDGMSGISADGSADILWSLIGQLSTPQRTAFMLRETEDLSCGEIAAVMGCTAATVRSHLSHARRQLRDDIKMKYPELLVGVKT